MTGPPRSAILVLGRGPAAMDSRTEGTGGRRSACTSGARALTHDASPRVNHAPEIREALA